MKDCLENGQSGLGLPCRAVLGSDQDKSLNLQILTAKKWHYSTLIDPFGL